MRYSGVTENGVCYDVEHSPYEFTRLGVTYRFSSIVHMEKFKREIVKREEWLTDSMSRRLKCDIDMSLAAGMQLYQQIEKRGFSINCDGKDYQWPQEVKLDGLQLKKQDCVLLSQNTTEQLLG